MQNCLGTLSFFALANIEHFFVSNKGFDKKMQRILLIRFLKTVFHVVTKGEKRGYRGSGGRMGLGEDVILRFFLGNGLFSGVE